MNGVEILSQTTMYNTILPAWFAVIGIAMVALGTAFIIEGVANYNQIAIIFAVIALLIGILFTVLSLINNKRDIDYIEYKVTIDDSVSMNEFLDKYEILDQEGKIYTVKERE